MKQMQDVASAYDCSVIAVMDVAPDQVSNYGIVVGDEIDANVLRVSSMVEKPRVEDAPSNLAVIGYILRRISSTSSNPPNREPGEIQLTDALNALAQTGKLLAYRFSGRFDCGSVDGYVAATDFYYRNVVLEAATTSRVLAKECRRL